MFAQKLGTQENGNPDKQQNAAIKIRSISTKSHASSRQSRSHYWIKR